jgi:hypothetical protein
MESIARICAFLPPLRQFSARSGDGSYSLPKTVDIGEKLAPRDVVFRQIELSQPAVIAVKGSVFG